MRHIATIAFTAVVCAGLGFVAGQRLTNFGTVTPTQDPVPTPQAVGPELIPLAESGPPPEQETATAARPLAEVVDGAAPRLVDITDREARLVFRSTVPLVGSVVYGATDAFGMVATEAGRGGRATVDHAPLLTGLAPDTEYYYRVQGVAEDGTLFVGEVRRFRSAHVLTLEEARAWAAAQSARGTANLARLDAGMAVLGVSSNFGSDDDGAWGINRAFDGNRRSEWSSDGDGDDAWFEIDLGGAAHVSAVELWSRTMGDGTAQIYSFSLTGDDGTALGPFVLPDITRPHRFAVDLTTATLRFDVETSSGGNTGLVEFEVLGTRLDRSGGAAGPPAGPANP